VHGPTAIGFIISFLRQETNRLFPDLEHLKNILISLRRKKRDSKCEFFATVHGGAQKKNRRRRDWSVDDFGARKKSTTKFDGAVVYIRPTTVYFYYLSNWENYLSRSARLSHPNSVCMSICPSHRSISQ